MGNMLPLVFLGLIVLLAWACIVTIVRVCTLPKGVARGGSCGRCAYPYSGWQWCPECGGEIGDVGITTPRMTMKYRGSLWTAAIGLIFFGVTLSFLMTGGSMALCQWLGWNVTTRQTAYTPQVSPNVTAPPPLFGVLIHWDIIGSKGSRARSGDILIVVDPTAAWTGTSATRPSAKGLAHTTIDARTGVFVSYGKNGEVIGRGEFFGAEDASALLEAAGVALGEGDRELAAMQLADLASVDEAVAAVTMRPGFGASGPVIITEGTTSVMTVPTLPFPIFGRWGAEVAGWLSMAASAVVVIVLGAIVVKRRRRLLGPAIVRSVESA